MAFNYNPTTQDDKIKQLEKEHRTDKAKTNKEMAVQKQQIDLLTLQLNDANEREQTLKKNYESMIAAINMKLSSKDKQIEMLKEENDNENFDLK